MNILDRYFLKEFLKPLGCCLMAFLLCMVVYDLYDNIYDFIQAKVPFVKILHYYAILIPAWIVLIMPIALLLALLYVLSDMSKHGELTAMRASGLDFFRLMGPYFVVGVCFSMQMLSLNLAWAPNALYRAKVIFDETTQSKSESKEKVTRIAYHDIAGNRFWMIDAYDPSTQTAWGIEIVQSDETQHDQKKISAGMGTYQQGHWSFKDVIIYDYTLPLSDPNSLKRFAALAAPEFVESPQRFIATSKKTKRMTTPELLDNLSYASRLPPKKRAAISTEFHSRIAYPVANLVVFLIGVPFGVVGQRRSTFLAIVNALLFFFAYILLMKVMMVLSESGRVPAGIAAWLPNILFAAIGIFLIRKIR